MPCIRIQLAAASDRVVGYREQRSEIASIVAGAFGAHATSGKAVEWLHTGGQYQLIHAAAAVALAREPHWRFCAKLLLIGAGIFAGSLYLMACGAPHWLGAVTPIGGGLMIGGWLCLAVKECRNRA